MAYQSIPLRETASIVVAIVFRFASFCRIAKLSRDETPDGSLHAFAWDDIALTQSLSTPLQHGFRFFRLPLPASPWAYLTVRFPSGRDTGLPRSM